MVPTLNCSGVEFAFAVERQPHLAEAALQSELGRPIGAERELRAQLGRRHFGRAAAERLCSAGRKARQQRQHRRHVARVEVETHVALRRGAGQRQTAARRQRRAAEVADHQPVDGPAVGVDLHLRAQVMTLDAGDGGASDLGGDGHVLRALERRAGEQRAAEAERHVEIELGRVERGVELGRMPAGGENVSKAPGDGAAREFGAQPLERDLFAAERELAAHVQRARIAGPARLAALQPGGQRLGIGRVDLGRTGEGDAGIAEREVAAQPRLREAGRAEFEGLEIPAMGVGADVAAQVLHHPAGERELIDADADLQRDDRTEGAARQLGELAQRCAGRGARCGIAAERAVEIDLPAGQHAFEARRLAELQIGDAGQFDAMLLRAVEEIDVLDQHGGRARLDLAGAAARAAVPVRRRARADRPAAPG